ncbi:unnamed protein product, partial [Prorocentrum cordatum]
ADRELRTVSVSWRYSGWVANFCGPSTEQVFFDEDGKISRLIAFIDWRRPRPNATREAFGRFESMLHVWRKNASEAVALKELFAEDVRVTFWNDATRERLGDGSSLAGPAQPSCCSTQGRCLAHCCQTRCSSTG